MVITIDGPAGSGKSTAARMLAKRLAIAYLDTGAMYRAAAHYVLDRDARKASPEKIVEIVQQMNLVIECAASDSRVLVDGRDVSRDIRSMEVSQATAVVAGNHRVRELMVDKQREIGSSLGSFVTEGRDQGSVVFPDADIKFVLEGSAETRARRRVEDLQAVGEEVSFEQVLQHLKQRDAADAVQWAPLLTPGAAIQIDTTDLSIDEVVDALEKHVRGRISVSGPL